MKKFDIQSIQVSKENEYPCIQVSVYPSMHDIQLSNYPSIQKKSVSKISMYPDIQKKWYPLIPICIATSTLCSEERGKFAQGKKIVDISNILTRLESSNTKL